MKGSNEVVCDSLGGSSYKRRSGIEKCSYSNDEKKAMNLNQGESHKLQPSVKILYKLGDLVDDTCV